MKVEQHTPLPSMLGASWVVTAVFILSNTPTPLYVRWQDEIGFSSTTLTVIFGVYILGLLLTLLIAGQLSDRYGRRPVLLPGMVCGIVATALFLSADTVAALMLARFLSGISVGIVVSAGMAAIVDVGGPGRQRQAALLASSSMVLGAGLGPLMAGAFALSMPQPIKPIFGTELVILASAVLVVLWLPLKRPVERSSGWRLRLPGVPRANRRHLALGVSVFAPGITATSFVLGLGPSLLARLTDVTSPLIAGAMACAMFLVATGMQFLLRGLRLRTIFLTGAGTIILAMATIALAVWTSSPVALIVGALLAGGGQGLGQLGGVTLLSLHVPGERRAEANAVFNMGGYVPAGLMPVATGVVIDWLGLAEGVLCFVWVLGILAGLGGLFVARCLVEE